MKPEERRPAQIMLCLGVGLALLGLVPSDRRLAILCWLVAIPMVASGAIAMAWGNATAEVHRFWASRD